MLYSVRKREDWVKKVQLNIVLALIWQCERNVYASLEGEVHEIFDFFIISRRGF